MVCLIFSIKTNGFLVSAARNPGKKGKQGREERFEKVSRQYTWVWSAAKKASCVACTKESSVSLYMYFYILVYIEQSISLWNVLHDPNHNPI